MIDQYLAEAKTFVLGNQFWYYHGVGLSVAWLVLSLLGILARKALSGQLKNLVHALIFAATDITTIALAGGAFYRVYPHLHKFWEWTPLKQGHIVGGALFTVLVIFQHAGGVSIMLKGIQGKPHKQFGMILSTVMRLIAVAGWYLAHNERMAMIAAGVTLADAFILAMAGKMNSSAIKAKGH